MCLDQEWIWRGRAWCAKTKRILSSQVKSAQVSASQDKSGQKWPPALTSGRGGVFSSWMWRSGPPRQFRPQKKIWRFTEHRKILVPKASDLGQKIKVLGSNFFLDGSTHLISLDDFPGKKSGERSRKTEKFLRKVQNWKKNLEIWKISKFFEFSKEKVIFLFNPL